MFLIIFIIFFIIPGFCIFSILKKNNNIFVNSGFYFPISLFLFLIQCLILVFILKIKFSIFCYFYVFSCSIISTLAIFQIIKKKIQITYNFNKTIIFSLIILIILLFILNFQDVFFGIGDYNVFLAYINRININNSFLEYDPIYGKPFIDIRYRYSIYPYLISFMSNISNVSADIAYKNFLLCSFLTIFLSLFSFSELILKKLHSKIILLLSSIILFFGQFQYPYERTIILIPAAISLYCIIPIFLTALLKEKAYLIIIISFISIFIHIFYSGFLLLFLLTYIIYNFINKKKISSYLKLAIFLSLIIISYYKITTFNILVNNTFFHNASMNNEHIKSFVTKFNIVSPIHFFSDCGILNNRIPFFLLFFMFLIVNIFQNKNFNFIKEKQLFLYLTGIIIIMPFVFIPFLAKTLSKFITSFKVIRLHQFIFWPILLAIIADTIISTKRSNYLFKTIYISSILFIIFNCYNYKLHFEKTKFHEISTTINELCKNIPKNSIIASDIYTSFYIPVFSSSYVATYSMLYSCPMTTNSYLRHQFINKLLNLELSENDIKLLNPDFIILPSSFNKKICNIIAKKYNFKFINSINNYFLYSCK